MLRRALSHNQIPYFVIPFVLSRRYGLQCFEEDWIFDIVFEKFGHAFQQDNIYDLSFIWGTFPFSLIILDIFYDNCIVV